MPVELDTQLTERDLARGLKSCMPRGENSNNRLLLRPIANQINDTIDNIHAAERAVQIQNAETIDQLYQIGKSLELPPNDSEGLEHYRARLLAESQLVTSKGTPNDVIDGAATMLGIDERRIDYDEPAQGFAENGTASIGVPQDALQSSSLTEDEAAAFADRFASVGCRIESFVKGTFTYITPTKYNDGDFDATKGYDGLDTNGDPKDNGGTYAGVI